MWNVVLSTPFSSTCRGNGFEKFQSGMKVVSLILFSREVNRVSRLSLSFSLSLSAARLNPLSLRTWKRILNSDSCLQRKFSRHFETEKILVNARERGGNIIQVSLGTTGEIFERERERTNRSSVSIFFQI